MIATQNRRRAVAGLAAALAIVTAGCSSTSGPGPATGGSSTPMAMDTNGAAGAVDRTNPEAVATTFATLFASGDTPTACKLMSSDGIATVNKRMSGFCENRQKWDGGGPQAGKHCSDGHGGLSYDFSSGMVYNSYRAFEVQLRKAQDGRWAVYGLGLADNSDQLSCING